MIGKILGFITGFFVGTFFGYALLEKVIKLIVERLVG